MAALRDAPVLFAPALAAFLLTAAWPLAAQQTPQRPPEEVESAAEAEAEEETGERLSWDAGLTLADGYTDNVFSTELDRRGDFFMLLLPQAELTLRGEGWRGTVAAEAEIGRFATETSENYADALLRAEGRLDIAEGTFLFAGADHAWEHEDRASPDAAGGLEPTLYREASGFAGVAHSSGDLSARFGVNARRLDYDDVRAAGGGRINTDDRDRDRMEIGGRVGYGLDEDRTVFLQGLYDVRDYDAAADDFGYQRDSQGFQAGLGLAGRLGPVAGEAMLGVLSQDYDDPRFDTVTAPDAALRLTWRPDILTRISATFDRSLEETTLFDTVAGSAASGYLSTGGGLRAARRLSPDLDALAWAYFTENDYQDLDRTDHITDLGARLRWHFTRHMFLAASYSYLQRNSDAAGADYDAHTAMISLGAALDPAYPEGAPVSELGESGFYAGLQAGRAALTTAQEGPRGGGRGTVTSDFGDLGVTAGGFVGWRGEAAGLVFGAELDAEAADSAWAHKGNRDFALRRKDGYGASLIFGVRTARDALLYARGGAVLSRFETEYATSTAPRVSGSHDLVGMRGGFGIEAPVSDSLSARLEYVVSAWPDYAFSASGAPDSFAPMEGQARAGLVWRFGGEARAPSEAPPPDFDGFYGGLQIGHGALASENSGPRPDAAAPRFRLDVTRASSIASLGAFAGYGRRLGDLWLGAEIESDFSAGDWNLERSGSRVYDSRRLGSFGASARMGWILADSVMLYARAGPVLGGFETDYSFRGVRVSESELLTGLRFGVGMEVPLSEKLGLRLDWSETRYEDFEVDYGAATDRFEPRESLVRLGMSWRF